MEKECKKHGLTKHRNESKTGQHWRCCKCGSEAVQKRREKIKEMSIEYKGGGCERCGYNKCVAALDFHHKDPSQKSFSIGSRGYTRSFEKVKVEIDKCEILCANCHREEHYFKKSS